MVCDTSSLKCKCCEESEGEDGEADDKWARGRREEDGIDKVGHFGRSVFCCLLGMVVLDASKDEEDVGGT